jgi:hypothetical protein
MHLTLDWSDKLSEALRVADHELTYSEDRKATIFIESIIVQGEAKNFLNSQPNLPLKIDPHLIADVTAIWSLVGDSDLYPLFRAGDVIRLQIVAGSQDEKHENYIGRLCVVRPLRIPRRIIGILERGETSGTFTVRPFNGPPLENIEIDVLAIVEQAYFHPILTDDLKAELQNIANRLNNLLR